MIVQSQFTEIYDEHANSIFRFCLFKTNDREDALELVQDTFLRAWDYVNKGKEVKNMKALLYKIANHLIIDHSRKKKKHAVSLEELMDQGFQTQDLTQDSESKLQKEMDSKMALDLLSRLKPKYKDVILLRYMEELSIPEIATSLRLNKNIVSVRLNRALKQLNQITSQ